MPTSSAPSPPLPSSTPFALARRWLRGLLVLTLWAGVFGAVPGHGLEARTRAADPSETAPVETLATIAVRDLPIEAREVLAAIRRGGPFEFPKDGTVFFNREKLLPYRPRGYYTEYTVRTPGLRHRGARRIVAGGDPRTSGIYYYTEDHYQRFLRIRE